MRYWIAVLSSMVATGCGTDVPISGTVTLPAGMTVAPGMSCADIEVAAFNRFLDSQNEEASTVATGDITTGHCEFVLNVQSGGTVQVGSRPYHPTELKYTDCPDTYRWTFIDEQRVSLLLPFPVVLELTMRQPSSGCP